jgi:hypothetical protein
MLSTETIPLLDGELRPPLESVNPGPRVPDRLHTHHPASPELSRAANSRIPKNRQTALRDW